MRALIVDDSSFIRDYIAASCWSLGWVCEEAGDGEEALAVCCGLAARCSTQCWWM